MARSLIKRRQNAEREHIAAYEASLRRVSQRRRPAPDFLNALTEAEDGLADKVIRAPETWRPKMKTRDAGRLRLAAARHLFAQYHVPAALDRIWLDQDGLAQEEVMLRKRWYVTVAGGGSLYKAGAGEWLTRKEVHAFLNGPDESGFEEAFWHAIAWSYTESPAVAREVARSKIARTPRVDLDFWREAARFFCANPMTLAEINDLHDFLAYAHEADADYSLKGRTARSLRRQMEEWHRDLAAVERIEVFRRRAAHYGNDAAVPQSAWRKSPIPDWEWEPSKQQAGVPGETYVMRQLSSPHELIAEGRAMRHCVASYASSCVMGYASIWGLRRCVSGRVERMLTIELDPLRRAVQVRGKANRPPRPDERKIVERWAKACGVTLAE